MQPLMDVPDHTKERTNQVSAVVAFVCTKMAPPGQIQYCFEGDGVLRTAQDQDQGTLQHAFAIDLPKHMKRAMRLPKSINVFTVIAEHGESKCTVLTSTCFARGLMAASSPSKRTPDASHSANNMGKDFTTSEGVNEVSATGNEKEKGGSNASTMQALPGDLIDYIENNPLTVSCLKKKTAE